MKLVRITLPGYMLKGEAECLHCDYVKPYSMNCEGMARGTALDKARAAVAALCCPSCGTSDDGCIAVGQAGMELSPGQTSDK
ncbi:TPA: hypothetical protein ACIPBP_002794 [Salmonella enterica subsp. enterica serovar Birkenhead]